MSVDQLLELSPDNESTTLNKLDDPAIAAEQRKLRLYDAIPITRRCLTQFFSALKRKVYVTPALRVTP